MKLLDTALDWAKAEMFSSIFFVLFGVLFLAATVGFWQLGKTDMARALIWPLLVTGLLLLVIGLGLTYSNWSRLSDFPEAYAAAPDVFLQEEIARAQKTMADFQRTVFTTTPVIVIVAAHILIFVSLPVWRGICLATIAMLLVIMLIDSTAYARMEAYHEKLLLFQPEQDL